MNTLLINQRVAEICQKQQLTILVTGAAGFIGSNLCHMILDETSHSVVGLDAMLEGSSCDNLPDSCDRFTFHEHDLRGPTFQKTLSQYPIDVIIHLAAQSHVDRSFSQSRDFWSTQVQGTRNLCEFAVDIGHPLFINQITDEVYGPSLYPILEDTFFVPTSPYACSKAAQHYVGQSFMHTWNLPVISTFPCNTFGPRQFTEKLIPKFLTRLISGEKVPLMKSSHFSREWLTVSDHCRALLYLIQHGQAGENYNIGPGTRLTNMQLTKELLLLTGRDESYIETVPDRQVHDESYSVDCTKIRELGWEPEENFYDYLELTSQWYQGKDND